MIFKNKMNKKAKFGDILMNNITYLLILIVFFIGMLYFVYSTANGSSVWSDFYAKEITKVIDSSRPGDYVSIDVRRATEIAAKNKVKFEDIFSFDNAKNEICVQLSSGRKSCFNYFNDVKVENYRVKLLDPVNVLSFEITGAG